MRRDTWNRHFTSGHSPLSLTSDLADPWLRGTHRDCVLGKPMPCSRDKKKKEPKKGRYLCKNCGQVRKKKRKLCEPRKVKQRDLSVIWLGRESDVTGPRSMPDS